MIFPTASRLDLRRARAHTAHVVMLEERLRRVFSTALGLAPECDVTALAYAQNPAWDSVAHMQLISALEGEFEILLDTEDVLGLSSFREAERIVRKYGVV